VSGSLDYLAAKLRTRRIKNSPDLFVLLVWAQPRAEYKEMKMKLKLKLSFVAAAFVVLSAHSLSATANTYVYKDGNGQRVFSDRPPVGVPYEVKVHPKPVDAPIVERRIASPVSLPNAFAAPSFDPVARNMVVADAASAINERDRKKAAECISIQQTISRLSSSRNRSIDPDTGGSLEERHARDAQQVYDSICR
jgi:hypothetical protein